MRLNDFLYVVTLAKEKSFSKASARLYISQSALSQAIKRIESEIGSKLLIRDTAGTFELTDTGKMIVDYGTDILQNEQELMHKLLPLSENNTLYIGAGNFGAKYYLPAIVREFTSKFPNIIIQISESHSIEMQNAIISGDIDICMLHTPILCQDDIEFVPIFDEKVLLAVPYNHPLSKKYGESAKSNPVDIDLSDAAEESFIFWKKEERFGQRALKFCKDAGFEPNVIVEIMDFEAINALVACGMGIGFVTSKIPEVPSGNRPNYYCFKAENTVRTYGLAYLKKSSKKNLINIYLEIAKNALKDV